MRTSLKSAAAVLLAALVALALAGPGPARAESEAAPLVDVVTSLSTLRDQVADNWALTMKYGWEATLVLDEEYGGDEKIKSTGEDAARLEALLKSGPAEDQAKADQLVQTLAQIRLAEKKYMDSINRVRNSAAQSLLVQISMAELSGGFTRQTDAIFFGEKSAQPALETGSAVSLEDLESFGFKPEIPLPGFKVTPPAETPGVQEKAEAPAPNNDVRSDTEELAEMFEEMQSSPADPEPVPPPPAETRAPSTDPETLRLAYEAYKAYQSIRNDSQNVSSNLQWAMYDQSPVHVLYKPNLMYLEAWLTSIRRLPGLTESQLKVLNRLPAYFQETLDNIAAFDDNLKLKKTARDDLEKLVGSALAQIDEMRSDYLNRLRGDVK